jgi:hypothetical protein
MRGDEELNPKWRGSELNPNWLGSERDAGRGTAKQPRADRAALHMPGMGTNSRIAAERGFVLNGRRGPGDYHARSEAEVQHRADWKSRDEPGRRLAQNQPRARLAAPPRAASREIRHYHRYPSLLSPRTP